MSAADPESVTREPRNTSSARCDRDATARETAPLAPAHAPGSPVARGLRGVVSGALQALRPVSLLNAVTPRRGLHRVRGVAYGEHPRQRLDVYTPQGPVPQTPRPMVVFFYGGSWQSGSRDDYLFVAQALATHGCVTVVPDYRLYPQVKFPDFVHDGAAAFAWALEHAPQFGADPRRIFVMGHSAGAQIATLLATDASYLQACELGPDAIAGVIGVGGAYDFLPLRDPVLKQVFPARDRHLSQPLHFVQGEHAPMLLAVSVDDTVVDPGNTERMAARLITVGSPVRVLRYRRLGHVLILGAIGVLLRPFVPLLREMGRFIDEQGAARSGAASHPPA